MQPVHRAKQSSRLGGAASPMVLGAVVAVLIVGGFVLGLVVGYRLGTAGPGDAKIDVTIRGDSPLSAGSSSVDAASRPSTPQEQLTPSQATTGRSPIPQPSERIDTPILAGSLDPGTQILAPKTGTAVSWQEAGQYVGKTITVEGKVTNTHNTGEVCFLNFTPQWQGTFYVVIFKEALNSWEKPPQTYFQGRTIRVTGRVYMHKDRPQIRVEDPVQIAVVN